MRQQTIRKRRTGPIGDLVRQIADYQDRNRLTDREIAKKLGVSRTGWNNARLGLYRPNLPFARKAATVPEFRELAERVLMPELDSAGDRAAAS